MNGMINAFFVASSVWMDSFNAETRSANWKIESLKSIVCFIKLNPPSPSEDYCMNMLKRGTVSTSPFWGPEKT